MGNCTVYMHIFPNKKVYIGITSQSVFKRWQRGYGYKTAWVYHAILKYGWENIEHIILYENLTKEQAKQMEIELIKEHKSNIREFGYNISEGGFLPVITEITKEKLRKANIGKKQSNETIKKRVEKLRGQKRPMISKLMSKRKGINNPNYGKTRSEIAKNKTSETMKLSQLGINNNNAKSVIQYDKNGNFINEYSTIIEAVRELNLKSNHIPTCCKGKCKTAHGYVWKYKEVI